MCLVRSKSLSSIPQVETPKIPVLQRSQSESSIETPKPKTLSKPVQSLATSLSSSSEALINRGSEIISSKES